MGGAKALHDWAQTSSLMCQQYNLHRGEGADAASPEDFSPFKREKREELAKVGIEVLGRLLTGRAMPKPRS